MEITGSAQHEAWQSRSLPPVERLRDGLWSIPVPIPDNPLRYVSVYAFSLHGGGLGLLDTGWDSDESWTTLTRGLASIGGTVEDVRGVLVTHLHFDHLGLANRVREGSGAWIAMHPADAGRIAELNRGGGAAAVASEADFLVGLGADRSEAEADIGPTENMERFARMAVPDRLLEDGELADFPGWRLRAVHTPGHTPGHLCFAEEHGRLFFSGDHVLPRISPNISTNYYGLPDPLFGLETRGLTVGEEVLQPGDWLALYTDGLTEARDAAGRWFGEERLIEFLTHEIAGGQPPPETVRRLTQAVLAHQNGLLQDDASILLACWTGGRPA